MKIFNRRARFDFEFLQKFCAGIILTGNEVKSLRKGAASLNESFITHKENQIIIKNMHISHYQDLKADCTRDRVLLLRKREKDQIINELSKKGNTCICLEVFFNKRGLAKMEIAIAVGAKKFDKREKIKKREWDIDKQKIMKTQRLRY